MQGRKLVRAVAKGLCIFSGLVFLYIAIDVHVWPWTISEHLGLSTWIPVQEDHMAVVSFALSGLSFITWEYLRVDHDFT